MGTTYELMAKNCLIWGRYLEVGKGRNREEIKKKCLKWYLHGRLKECVASKLQEQQTMKFKNLF